MPIRYNITIYTCDIKGCDEEVTQEDDTWVPRNWTLVTLTSYDDGDREAVLCGRHKSWLVDLLAKDVSVTLT